MTSKPKICFLCMVLCSVGLSLTSAQTVEKNNARSGSQSKSGAKQEKEGKPKFTKYELEWKSIDSHQTSILQVWGKDYKFSEKFKDGDAPWFNALEEQLEPGRYAFSVGFIPNEIADYQNAQSEIRSMRKDLLGKRREMIESGNRDAAKEIYQQANSLRQQARELQMKRSGAGQGIWQKKEQNSKLAAIKQQGHFTVHEDRSIEVFDPAKEKAAKAAGKEHRELKPDEESASENRDH